MTTINTIEDLARILRDQPTWAEALRALILAQDLLELPGRFDRFVQAQQESNSAQREANEAQQEFNSAQREANKAQQEFNRTTDQRLNAIEGRLGNLEGGEYERNVRNRALARCMITLGFQGAYVALAQTSPADPRLTSAIAQAIQNGRITPDRFGELFEADLIITADDNRHAVIEVSITADQDDIDRAKNRAGILSAITGGTVTPVVITSRLNPAQVAQAEAAGVTTFAMSYP